LTRARLSEAINADRQHSAQGTAPLRRFAEWALMVTKNWRMTFRINAAGAIEDMDLEDYH